MWTSRKRLIWLGFSMFLLVRALRGEPVCSDVALVYSAPSSRFAARAISESRPCATSAGS
jgi:hypothetical protein